MSQVISKPLRAAREAHERHAWTESYDAFGSAGSEVEASADDLAAYAEAAWWCAKLEEAMNLKERAFTAYSEDGRGRKAAGIALSLVFDHFAKNEPNLAISWIAQAGRLLEKEEEGPEHGYLAVTLSFGDLMAGDIEAGLEHARSALEIAERFGDVDGEAQAHLGIGRALVGRGDVDEGMSHLNQAIIPAMGGELGPQATGTIYCATVMACNDLGDYRKAGEWSEAGKRWCDRQANQIGFPGACKVHRAEVMRLRGNWAEALVEATKATGELMNFNMNIAAQGFYEIGEIKLHTGDLLGAEEAFGRANELGREPQPGLALLRLAQGKIPAAVSSLKRSLDDVSYLPSQPMAGSPSIALRRARLLFPQVEVSIAGGDLETAKTATAELTEVADKFGPAPLRAAVEHSTGLIAKEEGDLSKAESSFRGAVRLWQEADVPYEGARARVQLAHVYRAEGDDDAALLELQSARAIFERLGAGPDLGRTHNLISHFEGNKPAPRAVKTFLFSDIVRSTNLVEAIGDEAWEDLLRWHDQALRSAFADFAGDEVKQVGDGFFVAFDDQTSAIECAVTIQERLAEHRKSHGFAPQVRIGIHSAEATKKGSDYQGKGVHEAARIGALAEGGEILASRTTIEGEVGSYSVSEPRRVELKGIAQPIEVVSIAWR